MAVPALASTRRALTWCFLTAVTVASMEALGFLTINAAEITLNFTQFAQRFVNTAGIIMLALLGIWLVVGIFMVWLGGVRSGMALFFTLSAFALYAYLLVALDLLFAFTTRFADDRSLLIMDTFYFALISAGLTSLILGKLSRRFPITITPRAFTIVTVLLAGTAFAAWARSAQFPHVQGSLYWGGIAAAAVTVTALLWWLGRTPRRLRVTLAALSLAVFVPLPWTLPNRPAPALPPKASSAAHPVKHVILITVDTLRRDALGCYNPNTTGSPNIDTFARDTALFTNAFSASPWTYPSVASILTGLPPRVHQLTDGKTALPENVPTLAQAMTNAGYHTAALGFNGLLLPLSKLNRGFNEYHWYPIETMAFSNFEVGITQSLLNLSTTQKPSATVLTDLAVQWFKQHAKQDSFFWLHYFDPHMPYMPPDEFQPAEPKQHPAIGPQFWDVKPARAGSIARTPEERAWIRALYDGEIRYLDKEIGRLFDSLRKAGIYDDALIILTTDHGEEFWDHDRFEHGHTLYNELIHVPFLIKLPQSHSGLTLDACVTTSAIMPTVLNLCAVPTDIPGLLSPLSPLLQGPAAGAYAQQPIYTGASLFHDRIEGVIFDNMKYIRGTISGHEQLYNLKADPGETNSIAAHDLQSLEKGRQLLNAAMEADPKLAEQLGIRHDDKDHLNQQDVLKMQALGYL